MKKLLALLLLSALSARAGLEFVGYFTTSKDSYYMIADPGAGTTSGWLKASQSFSGYAIETFDGEHDTLVLRKGADTLRLPLREAKVKAGRATITGTIALGAGENLEGVRATLFLDEETAFPVKEGVTLHIKAERRPDGNLMYRSRFVTTGRDGKTETLSSPTVITLPGAAFSMRVGDLGYSFKP